MLFRVAEPVAEVTVFLSEHELVELATLFNANRFQLKVFYLADIIGLLIKLNSLQEKTNIR